MKAEFRNAETGPVFTSAKAERVGPSMQRRRAKMSDLADCRDALRRTCVMFLAALGLVAASSLAGVLVEAQAATETQCTDATSDDLASECEFETITSSGTNDCYLEADCPTGSGDTWNFTTITVPLEDVPDLVNCNGNLALSC